MQRKRDMEVKRRNENDGDREGERRTTSSGASRNKAPFAKPGQGGGSKGTNPDRRFSNDTSGSGPNRGSFQSPDVNRKDPFDPFESSEAADPFGEDPFGDESSDVVAKGNKPAQTTPVRTPPPVPVSLLDDDDEPPAARSSFTFGESSAPAFDPFGTAHSVSAPVSRRASDFSNDFAGLSFTVAPAKVPEQANQINPFGGSDSPSADELFEEESQPSTPAPPVSTGWTAPKNLVNLDFNAPSASSTTNAFSGRSPSLNLLLNGSSTRVQGSTGMNAPAGGGQGMGMNNNGGQMGMNNNNNGQMGMNNNNNGQMGMNNNNNSQMGMNNNNNGQMGMNNNNNGQMGMNNNNNGQMGMNNNNNGQMGMNNNNNGQMGMNNNNQMGMNNNGQMGGRQMMGMGQQGQGQGMMQQQQQYSQGGMMPSGIAGGMGGIQNNRMMMNNNMNQGQGQGQGQGMNMMSGGMQGQGQMQGQMQGQGQGQMGMYNAGAGGSMNLPSSSGATSSLAGAGVARGIPSKNGPKSSLDTINWSM